MALNYDNNLPEWENEGAEPSDTLKTNGFQVQQKPPAAIFNWFWSKTIKAITEVQTKLSSLHTTVTDSSSALTTHKTATTLDHPDGSVTTEKIADGAVTADKIADNTVANVDLSNVSDSALKSAIESANAGGVRVIYATSTDGVNYTATVDGVNSLYNGLSFIITANMDSVVGLQYLKINNFSAKAVMRIVSGLGYSGSSLGTGGLISKLYARLIIYNNSTWYVADKPVVSVNEGNVIGTLNVSYGGTGKSSLTEGSYLVGNGTDAVTLKTPTEVLADIGLDDLPIKSLAGQTVSPTSTTNVTAGDGATIIGDLRDRTFNGTAILQGNVASGSYAVAMGINCTASGHQSIAAGNKCSSNGIASVAMGYNTIASGNYTTAMGLRAEATGYVSTAMGWYTTANGQYSTAMGYLTKANGQYSTAMGAGAEATGYVSTAMGWYTTAKGDYSTAMGYVTTAGTLNTAMGKFNKAMTAGTEADTTGDAFVIGNGTGPSALSNAFRTTYVGRSYGLQSFGSSGADYAEYFEWQDGNPDNEDRRGLFVTLDGDKIRKATTEDTYILGVVSGNPSFVGDVQSELWQGQYLTDVFGEKLTQTVHIEAEYEDREVTDPETGETKIEKVLIHEAYDAEQWILNPDYDPEKEYISREDRKEWSAVGLVGKLVVTDDGTCELNGFCQVSEDGKATKAETATPYRVMERLDDNHIRIFIK